MTTSVTTRWWWVRHAPAIRRDGTIYGNSEVPCDTSDTAAIRALAARLPAGALWVTSHLGRARETAAALTDGDSTASEPLIEPDLAEQNFGEWQGRTYAALEREGNPVYHRYWLAPAHHTPPGGESFVAVVERVGAVIARLTGAHAGRDIIAVAHGGSIRAALAVALGLDAETALGFRIENLSLTRLDHRAGPGAGGDWCVVTVNTPAT